MAKRAQSSIRLGKSEYKSTAFERREFRSQLVHLLVASSGWRVGVTGRLVEDDEGSHGVWAGWPDALGMHRLGGFPVVY